jgi:hypothetical protein
MPRKKLGDVAEQVQGMGYKPKPKGPKRDRGWEQRQRDDRETTQVSYRGIPRELSQRVKEVAEVADLTVSEVARWLLEWGLEELESGRRQLP